MAIEIQAKHKQFDVVKDGDQRFPDQKETSSPTALISDTIRQQIPGE